MSEWAEAIIAAVCITGFVVWGTYVIVWCFPRLRFCWLYLLNTDVLSGLGLATFITGKSTVLNGKR